VLVVEKGTDAQRHQCSARLHGGSGDLGENGGWCAFDDDISVFGESGQFDHIDRCRQLGNPPSRSLPVAGRHSDKFQARDATVETSGNGLPYGAETADGNP